MFVREDPPGWITSEAFRVLAEKFKNGEINLRQFVESIYADYEKIRGEKPDIEEKIESHEGIPAEHTAMRLSFLISATHGFLPEPEPQPSAPRTVADLRGELIEAKAAGDAEMMFSLVLELIGLWEKRISALEEANNRDPFRLIGK